MTAPILQDVLAAVPGQQLEMTELAPGVPASKENLATLWAHVQKNEGVKYTFPNGCAVYLTSPNSIHRTKVDLRAEVLGPIVTTGSGEIRCHTRPRLCIETHKNTPEGLLQCFRFAKQSLRQYNEQGLCSNCRSEDMVIPPWRKLKAVGMPYCADCMIVAIMSPPEADALQTPAKRTRRSRDSPSGRRSPDASQRTRRSRD